MHRKLVIGAISGNQHFIRPPSKHHSMCWYGAHKYLNDYIAEKKCRRIMEIGVYNAENAENMIKTAAKNYPPNEIEYYGFDFFSHYNTDGIAENLDKLGCKYKLFKGNTMNTVPDAAETLPLMDIVFIDGGKSYREAWSDWLGSSRLMHMDTGVFVHNVDFSDVERMVNNIPQDRYNVNTFYAPAEGRVALITRKM